MRIFIVRHGQVPHNASRTYYDEDEDLTALGIEQANTLKNKIRDLDYDVIISSPLIRAIHTAKIINVRNRKIIVDDRLKERSPGNLSGKPLESTNREEYWNFNSKIQYGTSENMKTFFSRVFNFLDDLKSKEYASVLIVAHSGVSKAFSAYFQGINDGKFLEHGLKNCEIREYDL